MSQQLKLINVKTTNTKRELKKLPHKCSYCKICGRQLTDAISIQRGIGKECWEKYTKQKRKYSLFDKLDKRGG